MANRAMAQFDFDKNSGVQKTNFSRFDFWSAFEDLRQQSSDVEEMSFEEINNEIAATRTERRSRS